MTHLTMTTETQVSPGEETQIPTPEQAQTPEVATEETQAQDPQAESAEPESKEQRALKALERRLGKRTADVYRERAAREQLETRLRELEQRLNPQQPEQPQVDENVIETKAREIAQKALVTEKSNTVYQTGKKEFPDFDASLETVIQEAGPLIDRSGFPTALGQVVLEADNPAAVLNYLGKNPDVASELADLSPTQLARRMVSIEAKATAKPQTSSAPKPLSPVKPAAVMNELSSDLPIDEWMKRREQEARARRGR